MRAAYDALPKTVKDRLSTLVGLHGRSTGPAGEKLYGDDKGERLPGWICPLACKLPVVNATGQPISLAASRIWRPPKGRGNA